MKTTCSILAAILTLSFAGALATAAVTAEPIAFVQQDTAQQDADISRFAQGLRVRRLFNLAEKLCKEGLARSELNPIEQTTLVLELIRTQTAKATVSAGSVREQAWLDAQATADEFLSEYRNHPRAFLIEVQQGLSHLTQGRLLRQELEADIAPESVREKALSELRKANSVFAELQRKIEKQIPEQRSRSLSKEELSADQLLNLNNNVRLQMAITGINRARLYPADDKLNRIDALEVGLELLTDVRRQSNSDEPIWWQTELNRAKCNRLLGNLIEAGKILKELPLEEASEELKRTIAVEQIRLGISRGNTKTVKAMLGLVSQIPDRPAILDLAIVESLMFLAGAESDTAWKTEASEQMLEIEKRHGTYWGRRAEMLVIGKITNPDNVEKVPTGSSSELDLLLRVGDQALRKERFDAALKAYAKAAAQADQQKNVGFLFSASVRQSKVLERLNRHHEAYEVLVHVSQRVSAHEHAPAAHLRGCWNLSQTISGDPTKAIEIQDSFLTDLDRHIQLWPKSKTADQARLWAGRQLQSKREWKAAAERYLEISPTSRYFIDAIAQSETCIQAFVKSVDASRTDVETFSARLQKLYRLPTIENDLRSHVLLALAKIELAHGVGDPRQLAKSLKSSIPNADSVVKNKLNAQYIVSLALQDALPDASEQIIATISADLESLNESIRTINRILDRQPSSNLRKLYEIKLLVAKTALKLEMDNASETRWMGERADALQRLGRHGEAVEALTELASRKPKAAEVQLQIARSLTKIGTDTANTKALRKWRQLSGKLKPKSESWFEAKLNVASLLFKNGEKPEALKMLEFINAIPPGWSRSKWKSDFERLLIECQN